MTKHGVNANGEGKRAIGLEWDIFWTDTSVSLQVINTLEYYY